MTKEQWNAVVRLLDELASIPADQHSRFITERADSDPTIQRFLREVLTEEARAELPIEMVLTRFSRQQRFEMYGLDDYEILDLLGEGGMGQVLLARRRDDSSGRKVALKIIPLLQTSERSLHDLLRREQEVQTRLEHPNIARVYRWGETGSGRPFVEMEYIEGVPLDVYGRQRNLSLVEHLSLFRQVCDAVQFAHRNLVVHRDLKPGNILVDRDGTVKLLDFGIAKLVNASGEAASAGTTVHAFTPDYASPEQIHGQAITTASDVYSLGVLLYEMLCGVRPYSLGNVPVTKLSELIGELEVRRPSQVSVCIPRAHLRGDIDRIVMKALQREPIDRYESARQMAEDIGRFLENRPIMARDPTLLYRTGRFLKRNRLLVLFSALGLTLLLAFLWQQERQQQAIAEERDRTEVVAEFLVELFEGSDPYNRPVEDITVRVLLDSARKKLGDELHRAPAVQLDLLLALAKVYMNIGLYDEAQELAEEALGLWKDTDDQRPSEGAEAHNLLGLILQHRGKLEASRDHYSRALAIQEKHELTKERASTLANLSFLAQAQSQYEEAEKLYSQSIELAKTAWGPRHIETAQVQKSYGALLVGLGRLDEAEAVFLDMLHTYEAAYGAPHPRIADTLNSLGEVHRNRGEYAEAQGFYAKALDMWTATLGPESTSTAAALQNLGLVQKALGEYEKAASLYQQSLAIRRKVHGPGHPSVALSLNLLGAVADDTGEFQQAAEYYREALAIQKTALGEENVSTVITKNNLALILQHAGKYDAAQGLLEEVLGSLRNIFGAAHPNLALAHDNLGWLLFLRGEYGRAEEYLRQGLAMAEETLPPNHQQIALSATKLSAILLAQGRCDEAVPLAERAVTILESILGREHWRTATAEGVLGGCLLQERRFVEAESLLLPSQTLILETKGPKPQTRKQALRLLLQLYDAWGKPEKAAPYRVQLAESQQ